MNENILCERIAALRRDAGYTQEQLAQRLGVSFQAVSKWENAQCCPDIALLPAIADIFNVSIDSLFGRESAPTAPVPVYEDAAPGGIYPWADDDNFYAVVFRGWNLLWEAPVDARDPRPRISFSWDGPVQDLSCAFSVNCDAVSGSVTADGDVSCDDVGGNVEAGGSVSCDDVHGTIEAGGNVSCDDVAGSVNAGGGVNCGDVGSSVNAGGSVVCGDVGGKVTAGGAVRSDDAGGGFVPDLSGLGERIRKMTDEISESVRNAVGKHTDKGE